MEGGKTCNHKYQLQGSIRTHMSKAHGKTLLTRNYHTKDERELNYETLHEYQKHATKRPSQQPTLSAMPKFTFLHHIIV